MHHPANRKSLRLSALSLIVLTLGLTTGLTTARADIVQMGATLPPPTGAYTLPLICITAVCLENTAISNFNNTVDLLTMGNEVVTATATFFTDVFQNNSGSPGAFLGPLSIPGIIHFTFFGRSFSTPLGTFSSQITDFDFAGMFMGHDFEVKQNPGMASTGQTTITALEPPNFQVSSFFDVFAELSLNDGPFVPGPQRTTVLTSAVPEPGTAGLALLTLAGLAAVRLRRK